MQHTFAEMAERILHLMQKLGVKKCKSILEKSDKNWFHLSIIFEHKTIVDYKAFIKHAYNVSYVIFVIQLPLFKCVTQQHELIDT